MEPSTLLALLLSCAPHVDPGTAQALVAVESSLNPHAIGVVGGALDRQPRNRREALATAHALREAGWNFSIGLAQINVHNLQRLQLSLDSAFDPCRNLAAMQTVLIECFERSTAAAQRATVSTQHALRQALSCYYSGNFTTGFEHGYVRRVALHAHSQL
jgi:type IV secretion system protein VirB1